MYSLVEGEKGLGWKKANIWQNAVKIVKNWEKRCNELGLVWLWISLFHLPRKDYWKEIDFQDFGWVLLKSGFCKTETRKLLNVKSKGEHVLLLPSLSTTLCYILLHIIDRQWCGVHSTVSSYRWIVNTVWWAVITKARSFSYPRSELLINLSASVSFPRQCLVKPMKCKTIVLCLDFMEMFCAFCQQLRFIVWRIICGPVFSVSDRIFCWNDPNN